MTDNMKKSKGTDSDSMTEQAEVKQLWKELGLANVSEELLPSTTKDNDRHPENKVHTGIMVGLGGFFVLNLAVLLSLPPVLRGKGAPYLPTFNRQLDTMFRLLRNDASLKKRVAAGEKITFVDLGSGDGRIVFRASREKIFYKSIGVEINPLLHILAISRKCLQGPKYFSATSFHLQDIWSTNLENTHVVAIYGLAPIMDKLGKKLKDELAPDSIVLSNVFAVPGWKHSNAEDGVFVYRTPECWRK